MPNAIRQYIQDQISIWSIEIVSYIGYFWDALDRKIKNHTLLFLYMVEVFINKDKLSDYDKNILYWAILFHDIGKFHEMNTIYKEDYSKNRRIDKAHPFKSAIVFIRTVINQKLIFFNDEKETKEFIDPYNGMEDIKNKILRVTNPKAFKDDPLRVLRMARFHAQLDFSIEESTLQ